MRFEERTETVDLPTHVEITEVRNDGSDGILVAFSDGTVAGYVVEELIGLRPFREKCDKLTLTVKRPNFLVQ